MKKGLIFALTLIVSIQSALALSLDQRRKRIVSIIDEELSEIKRLSSQVKGQNPDYLLRMAELNLEKARLWRESENETYLELSDERRRKANKASYFKASSSFFYQANRYAVDITKKFPRYRNISDVYYILGYNAKEAGKTKAASRYFSHANKNSRGSSVTKVKSQISLAEIYYNKKEYRKAIPLYESALSKYQDKWWTKDSFNLAWCYYRANKESLAINKMKQVFKASSDKKYIDMRSQVERDVGLFYATSGRIDEGISFFRSIGINFTDQLLRIAVTLKSQGKYTEADKVLAYAVKYEKSEKRLPEIYIEKLSLYDKFGKEGKHLSASKKMYELFQKKLLSSNQLNTLRFQMQKQAARLQKQVVSKTYRRLKKTRSRKASYAIEYFEMLNRVDPSKAYQHQFHKAETAYANYDYAQAIVFYSKAFELAKAKRDAKFIQNSAEGMLATLGQKRLNSKIKDKYYAPVYEMYLGEWPRGRRSEAIYQKLFKVYLSDKRYDKAKGVLDRYAKNYPKNWKTQEAMIANMMEISRKNKDYGAIKAWISAINGGAYAVSANYKNKLQQLLTNIQIEGVQNSLEKGDKSVALRGYHKILEDPYSTPKSKINAKYNLAALYYELGSTAKAYKWSVEAIREMPVKDAISFSDSFLTISGFLFAKQEFAASADISTRVVAKLCGTKTRKKSVAFKNSVYLHLAEGDLKKAQDLIDLAKRCRIPNSHIVDAEFELLDEYGKQEKWTDYERLVTSLFKQPQARARLIHPLHTIEEVHKKFNNQSKAKLYSKLKWQSYRSAAKSKADIPLEALDDIALERLEEMVSLYNSLKGIKLAFPENAFNNLLKRKLGVLDQITKKAASIQQIGSGKGIIGVYKVLVEAYEHAASEVEAFTPPGKSKEYIASFKGSMAQVYQPLKQTAANYKKEGWSAIEKNKILSDFNYLLAPNQIDGLTVKYAYPHKAISMDRSGKK